MAKKGARPAERGGRDHALGHRHRHAEARRHWPGEAGTGARPGRRLPVVIVSMRASAEEQRRAIEAGADACMVKTDLSHAGLWTLLARFLG